MRNFGWNLRRDANEAEIVDALRQAGALVLHLNKFDLLVLFRGQFHMIECKTTDGELTESQQQLITDGWPLACISSPEDALRLIGAIR